jgi:hypothetical protein
MNNISIKKDKFGIFIFDENNAEFKESGDPQSFFFFSSDDLGVCEWEPDGEDYNFVAWKANVNEHYKKNIDFDTMEIGQEISFKFDQ